MRDIRWKARTVGPMRHHDAFLDETLVGSVSRAMWKTLSPWDVYRADLGAWSKVGWAFTVREAKALLLAALDGTRQP